MKYIKIVLPVLLVGVFFTGCGKSYKTIKCTNSLNLGNADYTAEYEINYDGDEVVKYVNILEKIVSEDADYLDQAKESTKELYDKTNAAYGGYDCDVKVNGDTLQSKCKVDYEKMDLKKYIEDNPSISSIIKGKDSIKLDESIQIYKSLGAKCNK